MARIYIDAETNTVVGTEDGRFYDMPQDGLESDSDVADFVASQPERMTFDKIFHKYADECERIYDNRTAGDSTFNGVMMHLYYDLKSNGYMR